jgi:hypothetical protein
VRVYLDSSAFAKRYLDEVGTGEVLAWSVCGRPGAGYECRGCGGVSDAAAGILSHQTCSDKAPGAQADCARKDNRK